LEKTHSHQRKNAIEVFYPKKKKKKWWFFMQRMECSCGFSSKERHVFMTIIGFSRAL
jgi:phage pi2 protein 07